MSVLVEAHSIVVRNDSLEARFPGGLVAYRDSVPNQTFCTDGSLTRVGFMAPADVAHWFESVLVEHGLGIDPSTGFSATTVVVDQMKGRTGPCDWISVADHRDGYRYCWLSGTDPGTFVAPGYWEPSYSASLSLLTHDNQGSPIVLGPAEDDDAPPIQWTTRVFDSPLPDPTTPDDTTGDAPIEISQEGSFLYSPEKGLGLRARTPLADAARFVNRAAEADPGGEVTVDGAFLVNMAMLYGDRPGVTVKWAMNRRSDWAVRLRDRSTCLEYAAGLAQQTADAPTFAELRNSRDLMSEAGHFLNAYSSGLIEDGTYAAARQLLEDGEITLATDGPFDVHVFEQLSLEENSRRATLAESIELPPLSTIEHEPGTATATKAGPPDVTARRSVIAAARITISEMEMVDGQLVHIDTVQRRNVTIAIDGSQLSIRGDGLAGSYDLASVRQIELAPDGSRLEFTTPEPTTGIPAPVPGTHVLRVDAYRFRSPRRSELRAFSEALAEATRLARGLG
jgi:hypothetical protein